MTTGSTRDPARGEPDRLLLVDDNPINLQVLYQTLNGQGYKLLVAKNGEAALEIARKAHPHLILLDIMMPGLDGYQVCERLKGDPDTADAAVIFLSALDDIKDKVRGFELGAVDYVSKPFQGEEVIARVNTHLTIKRLEHELAEANARMHRDLEAAARVQRSMLPAVLPETSVAKFAWRYHPCDQLAGDSLSLFRLSDKHVGMYVLDVTGHGVASSLLSVAVARSLMPRPDPSGVVLKVDDTGNPLVVRPADVLTRLNALYPMSSNANFFFTIVYGVLDTEARQFHFAAAGHPGPLHVAAEGSSTLLCRHGYTDWVVGGRDLRAGDRGLSARRPGLSVFRWHLRGEEREQRAVRAGALLRDAGRGSRRFSRPECRCSHRRCSPMERRTNFHRRRRRARPRVHLIRGQFTYFHTGSCLESVK